MGKFSTKLWWEAVQRTIEEVVEVVILIVKWTEHKLTLLRDYKQDQHNK